MHFRSKPLVGLSILLILAGALGSFHAPDQAFADAYAREFYARRGESVALWVVPREAITAIEEFPDEFDLKYRRVDGYSIKARLKEARERAGTAAP